MTKSDYRAKTGLFLNMYTDVVYALQKCKYLEEEGYPYAKVFPNLVIMPPKKNEVHRAYYGMEGSCLFVSAEATEQEFLDLITSAINHGLDIAQFCEVQLEYMEPITPEWTTKLLIEKLVAVWDRNTKEILRWKAEDAE